MSTIARKGSLPISQNLTLNSVHEPDLSYNLLSISKLTHSLNCIIKFNSSSCEFQDPLLGKMIGSVRECEGLYLFNDEVKVCGHFEKKEFISCNKDEEIMVWYCRLGYPNFPYLKHLFPLLFKNNDVSSFQCEICKFAKHHHSVLPVHPYKASKPFLMIHNDI